MTLFLSYQYNIQFNFHQQLRTYEKKQLNILNILLLEFQGGEMIEITLELLKYLRNSDEEKLVYYNGFWKFKAHD